MTEKPPHVDGFVVVGPVFLEDGPHGPRQKLRHLGLGASVDLPEFITSNPAPYKFAQQATSDILYLFVHKSAVLSRTYKHTPDMGEITGFGGLYEESCQTALDAGVKWLEEKEPTFLATLANPFAIGNVMVNRKAITDAMYSAVEEACPGAGLTDAQVTEVMGRCRWIQKHGWNAYVEWMRWIQYHRDMSGGKFVPTGGGL